MLTLGELAQRFSLGLSGDAAVRIDGVCPLDPGEPGRITFLSNPKLRDRLPATRAAAVIVTERDAKGFAGNALIAKDPYLAYARVAALFDRSREFTPGQHPSAVVAKGVTIPASAHVGALTAIGEGSVIGEGAYVGPSCVLGRNVAVGANCFLESRVTLCDGVRLGQRVRVSPGAVVGSRGFGLAIGPKGWEEVPQLGSVVIGDDVEIGANTTIDRGAVGDTVLENGVKLDNQIQIAHNVRIGAHTAMAAFSGVAGSARVGARCMIGGAATVNGHIEICDDVVVAGASTVTKSITEKGQYASSMWSIETAREWRRITARVRRLEKYEQRLREAEKRLGIQRGADEGEETE